MEAERKEKLEQLLNIIETAISDLVSGKVQSFRLGERNYTFYSIGELRNLRSDILQELNGGVKTTIVIPTGDY